MDIEVLCSLKEHYGEVFPQYCIRKNIILHRDKYDAFKAPSSSQLRECLHNIHTNKLILNKKLKKVQIECTKGLRRESKKTTQISCTKSTNPFLIDLRLYIQLLNSCASIPIRAVNTVSLHYILNTAKTGVNIYEYIMKETMGSVNIINYESSMPMITNLLSQFQRNHKKFDYNNVLMTLIWKNACSQNLKYEYEVPVEQIMLFYEFIFSKVVPLSIFGNLKNLKRIKKVLKHLLIKSRFKIYDLSFLIAKLNISRITWLKDVQSQETQWFILAKFIRWFFTGYLIKILHTYFHITSFSSNNNERIYIARSNWFSIQKKFIIKKLRSNGLHPDVVCNEWNPTIGIYKLYPKLASVRPILVLKPEQKEKHQLLMISTFLKQLKITEYGFTSFHETWKLIIWRERNSKMQENLYIVSCDVKDAFGSIIQGHLYDIIMSLCRKLPENLLFSTYAIKSRKYMGDDNILCYKKFFSNGNLQLPLPSGTLYACTRYGQTQKIQKSWLLDKIWQYISYQRVKIRNKIYIISKGVVQGAMLSPILSDIYYNYMLQKEMSLFLNCGKIIRYVDDILYVANDEMQARQFLQLIKEGIPNFNCYFKELKIQTNIINMANTVTNSINYIGYKINCDTLEIAPRYLSTHVRYLISFNSKDVKDTLTFFKKQLLHTSRLRLSTLVLDNSINSEANIKKTLKEAFLLQAKFTKVLIREIFNDNQYNVEHIIGIIKSSSMKIVGRIVKLFMKIDENMSLEDACTLYKALLNLIWSCYKHIFKRNKDLKKYFVNLPYKKGHITYCSDSN